MKLRTTHILLLLGIVSAAPSNQKAFSCKPILTGIATLAGGAWGYHNGRSLTATLTYAALMGAGTWVGTYAIEQIGIADSPDQETTNQSESNTQRSPENPYDPKNPQKTHDTSTLTPQQKVSRDIINSLYKGCEKSKSNTKENSGEPDWRTPVKNIVDSWTDSENGLKQIQIDDMQQKVNPNALELPLLSFLAFEASFNEDTDVAHKAYTKFLKLCKHETEEARNARQRALNDVYRLLYNNTHNSPKKRIISRCATQKLNAVTEELVTRGADPQTALSYFQQKRYQNKLETMEKSFDQVSAQARDVTLYQFAIAENFYQALLADKIRENNNEAQHANQDQPPRGTRTTNKRNTKQIEKWLKANTEASDSLLVAHVSQAIKNPRVSVFVPEGTVEKIKNAIENNTTLANILKKHGTEYSKLPKLATDTEG